MSKIGLGIITCNRQDFYTKCYKSVPFDDLHAVVTVNDGKKYKKKYPKSHLIQHKENKGVGISKNDALKYLIEQGCEHLFLIEDDIYIKDKDVFNQYISAAEQSGLYHMMFGYHGPANKNGSKGEPRPRVVVEYDTGLKIALNRHCVGAFCYYHKGVITNAGYFDETYLNVWEHVDHSYTIAKLGLIPAYWWWPDIANSTDYLDEQACSEELDKGEIRKREDWEKNITHGARHFYTKHNHMPTTIPDAPRVQVFNMLKTIKERYSREAVK